MSAWKEAVTNLAIDSAVNHIGSQIASRNVVKSENIDPEYQAYLRQKEAEDNKIDYEVFANAKLIEYQNQNKKELTRSRTVGLAVVGNMILPAIVQGASYLGVTMSADHQAIATLAVNFVVGAAAIYLRKQTTTTIK